ncbi:MAG TPA: phosphatase PAP2 family protein [Verrucomicrobiae bacterium]
MATFGGEPWEVGVFLRGSRALASLTFDQVANWGAAREFCFRRISRYNGGVIQVLRTFPRNVLACFTGWRWLGHLTLMLLTALLVLGGVDWWFYQQTRLPGLLSWMFLSAPIGFFVPILLPLGLLMVGGALRNMTIERTGWAIIQAELMGSLLSSTYKAFTGRAHPVHFLGQGTDADITREFQFGFLRGGVFWGWPSSHTTIAFAMAFTVYSLWPKRPVIRIGALSYALFIGLGVSMTIHWLSDFVAGAILGALIGGVVGRSFAASLGPVTPAPSNR